MEGEGGKERRKGRKGKRREEEKGKTDGRKEGRKGKGKRKKKRKKERKRKERRWEEGRKEGQKKGERKKGKGKGKEMGGREGKGKRKKERKGKEKKRKEKKRKEIGGREGKGKGKGRRERKGKERGKGREGEGGKEKKGERRRKQKEGEKSTKKRREGGRGKERTGEERRGKHGEGSRGKRQRKWHTIHNCSSELEEPCRAQPVLSPIQGGPVFIYFHLFIEFRVSQHHHLEKAAFKTRREELKVKKAGGEGRGCPHLRQPLAGSAKPALQPLTETTLQENVLAREEGLAPIPRGRGQCVGGVSLRYFKTQFLIFQAQEWIRGCLGFFLNPGLGKDLPPIHSPNKPPMKEARHGGIGAFVTVVRGE
ncbi:Octapeptide-repeat protein T2, partial [Ophiophagus hannah]